MKAIIDEIWAIYKINLGQNSRWNINLPLKINFGHWIKNWEQSGRWIAILPLESHLGRWINTGMMWAVRSCCMKEGKYHQKIDDFIFDISPIYRRYFAIKDNFFKKSPIYLPELIYRRYFGDIYANISPPIFIHEISCRPLPIHNISAIYHRYIPTFSSLIPTTMIRIVNRCIPLKLYLVKGPCNQ